MEDSLIELLEAYGFPVYRQGSLSDSDTYPSDFFTFWNSDSTDHNHYNNSNYGIVWTFDIYFYSNNPSNTYTYLSNAIDSLKSNGWIVNGRGFDVQTDEPTHTGRGFTAYYLEL